MLLSLLHTGAILGSRAGPSNRPNKQYEWSPGQTQRSHVRKGAGKND